jgi:hypothetical protein
LVADAVKASAGKEAVAAATAPVPAAGDSSNGRTSKLSGLPPSGLPCRVLTPQTPRGMEFQPEMKDPSGSKGAGIKHPPGSVRFLPSCC